MSKHTKGLWVAVGPWVELATGDTTNPDICDCDPASFGQGHLHRSQEEVLANARLISYAPYMYRVVEKLAKSGDLEAADIISAIG
jgi:hypothetical protein